ncbi:hypothetical protein ABTZ59_11480 [Streptomyces sp. NPDC094034]
MPSITHHRTEAPHLDSGRRETDGVQEWKERWGKATAAAHTGDSNQDAL